jgi:hypothetical protein
MSPSKATAAKPTSASEVTATTEIASASAVVASRPSGLSQGNRCDANQAK